MLSELCYYLDADDLGRLIDRARLDCRAEGGFGDYLKSLMQAP